MVSAGAKLCGFGVESCIRADERTCFRLVAKAESFARPVSERTRISGNFYADDVEFETLERPRKPTYAETLFVAQYMVKEDEMRTRVPTEM